VSPQPPLPPNALTSILFALERPKKKHKNQNADKTVQPSLSLMQMGSLRSSAARSSAGSLRVDSDSDDEAAAAGGGSLSGGTPGASSGRFGTQVACAYQQHRAFTGRGLHSSTIQLNLSRFRHKSTP